MKDMRTQIELVCKDLSAFTKDNTKQVSRKAIVAALVEFNKHVEASMKLVTTNSTKKPTAVELEAMSAEEKAQSDAERAAGINEQFHGMVSGEASSGQAVIDSLNMSAAESLNQIEVNQTADAINDMLGMANAGHEYFAKGVKVTIPVKCIQ
jgi:hypothetical protein